MATATKKVNGKSKGNVFERKTAIALSARFKTLTGIDSSFRRNPDSGAFFGGGNKARTDTHNLEHANFGDLICPTNFKFSVECKHYKSPPTFSSIIVGEVKQWDGWIAQCEQDSEKSKKSPLLIIKYNNVEEFVLIAHPVDTLTSCFTYKGKVAYRLQDLLTLPDDYFFD